MLTLYSTDPNVVGTYGAHLITHVTMIPRNSYKGSFYVEIEKTLRNKIQSEIDSQYEDSHIVVPNLRNHIDEYVDADLDRVIFTTKVRLVWFQIDTFKL